MLFGAQYYRPPFPRRECWRRDMEHMRDMGFNCVKLWAVWNWVEKEQGIYDFKELDELTELCREYGLQVIINTIPEGAPYWTYQGNDEDLYQTADGQKVVYGGPANIPSGGWPGLCMDNPEFAELTALFIEKTARHFAKNPAVISIDVWNEPHLEPMYDYRGNMLCYCRHSKAAFVKWLQEKYACLEALNLAWYRTYTSWDQVEPPVRFGTWADMLDWRKFWLDNMVRWLRIRTAAARRGAPEKKIQTHVAYSGILGNQITGGLANELGDEFLLAKEVDWFGLSSFPKWLMRKQHAYRHLMHSDMIAEASHGRLFYQVELQGGAGKPGLLGGEVPTEGDVRIWNWNMAAAGGKGCVYWQYAPEPAGIESPGFGLTGFRGEDTPRSRSAFHMARLLNQPWMEQTVRVPVQNAIYVSRNSDLLTFASERREEMYAGSLSGVYRAAYESGIPVRFLHQDYVTELLDGTIKFLYLPMALILTEEETAVFKQYMEQGGVIVSECCPGLYEDSGLLNQMGESLKKLFGVLHKEVQAMPDFGTVNARWLEDGQVFTGRFYRQLVTLQDASAIAVFDDGEPAVTEKHYGSGKAVWIGTYPSYYYENKYEQKSDEGTLCCLEGTKDLLTRWMKKGGYAEIEKIQVSCLNRSEVSLASLVRMLSLEEDYVLVAVNHLPKETEIDITFRDGVIFDAKGREKKNLRIGLPSEDGTLCRLKKRQGDKGWEIGEQMASGLELT